MGGERNSILSSILLLKKYRQRDEKLHREPGKANFEWRKANKELSPHTLFYTKGYTGSISLSFLISEVSSYPWVVWNPRVPLHLQLAALLFEIEEVENVVPDSGLQSE